MAVRVHSDKSFISVMGPFKMEVIPLTAVANDDTIESRLAAPSFAFMFPNADAGALTVQPSVTISGKTLTLRDPGAVTAWTVVVFGDAMQP